MSNSTAKESDEIDPESILDDKTNGPVCKFGTLTLKRGEKLKVEHLEFNDIVCRCDVPSFVTCSEN